MEDANDFAASFEQAIIDSLVGKMSKALKTHRPKTVILGGGVAANQKLRNTLANTVSQTEDCELKIPELFEKPNPKSVVEGYVQKTKWGKIILN